MICHIHDISDTIVIDCLKIPAHGIKRTRCEISRCKMLLDKLERKSAEEEQQKLLAQTDIDQAFNDYRDGEDSGFDDEHNEDYDEDHSVDNDDFDEDYDENEDDGFVISM